MGILPLNVETGRYLRKPLNERLCLLCTEREIEDEYHFICSCPCYKTECDEICSCIPNFKNLTPDDQFVSLMRLNPKVLAKFIESIWNKRKFLLEDVMNTHYSSVFVIKVTYKPKRGLGVLNFCYLSSILLNVCIHVTIINEINK